MKSGRQCLEYFFATHDKKLYFYSFIQYINIIAACYTIIHFIVSAISLPESLKYMYNLYTCRTAFLIHQCFCMKWKLQIDESQNDSFNLWLYWL